MANLDGICEECGNTGIVGDPCLVCGGRIESLDKGIEKFESEDETHHVATPSVSRSKKVHQPVLDDFDVDPGDEELEDIEEDLEELGDEFDPDNTLSMEDLAEEEDEKDVPDSYDDDEENP